MRVILVIWMLLLTGCAGAIHEKAVVVHNRAERLGTIGRKVVKRVGPLVAAGVCIATPEYCVLARAAYKAAVISINTIEELKNSEDESKIIILAQEFTSNIDNINEILVASGQEPLDFTEFQTELKSIKGETK